MARFPFEFMQSFIDEFTEQLEAFGSGSYLSEDDRDFWDQPFDPAVVPELKGILLKFADALPEEDAPGEAWDAWIAPFAAAVDAFNAKHDYAVVELEEEADLRQWIARLGQARGVELDVDAIEFRP